MQTAHSVRLLSVGVGSYPDSSIPTIPCASADAVSVYDTLAQVLQGILDTRRSLVVEDVTAEQFLTLVQSLIGVPGPPGAEVLYVFYFSGHAVIREDELEFCFNDTSGRRGTVSVAQLTDIFRKYGRPRTLIILDCCYAGLSKSITQSASGLFQRRSTVLASSQPLEKSGFDEDLNFFTRRFLNAVNYLVESGQRISIGEVAQHIRAQQPDPTSQHLAVYYQEGEADLVLKEPSSTPSERRKLVENFLAQIAIAGILEREVLWYALGEERECILLDATDGLRKSGIVEPSWIVRRAAGSALNEIKVLQAERRRMSRLLLESSEWTEVCIGIISARNDLGIRDFDTLFRSILISKLPMDAKWLAFLYLADHHGESLFDDRESLEASGLLATPWGLCEIWERIVRQSGSNLRRENTFILLGLCLDYPSKQALVEYIFFNELSLFQELDKEHQEIVSNHFRNLPVFSIYSKMAQRGTSEAQGVGKWLRSRLYGSWRGVYAQMLPKHLGSMAPDDLSEFLEASAKIPMVPARMAVFEQLQHVPDISSRHATSLSWGVSDAHPWVRRAAIEWLGNARELVCPDVKVALQQALMQTERAIYPGVLDLLLASLKLGNQISLSGAAMLNLVQKAIGDFSASDIDALNRECDAEGRPYKISIVDQIEK